MQGEHNSVLPVDARSTEQPRAGYVGKSMNLLLELHHAPFSFPLLIFFKVRKKIVRKIYYLCVKYFCINVIYFLLLFFLFSYFSCFCFM